MGYGLCASVITAMINVQIFVKTKIISWFCIWLILLELKYTDKKPLNNLTI